MKYSILLRSGTAIPILRAFCYFCTVLCGAVVHSLGPREGFALETKQVPGGWRAAGVWRLGGSFGPDHAQYRLAGRVACGYSSTDDPSSGKVQHTSPTDCVLAAEERTNVSRVQTHISVLFEKFWAFPLRVVNANMK